MFDPDRFARTLVSGMSEAIIYADETGLIQFWNTGAERPVRIHGTGGIGSVARHHHSHKPQERHWNGYRETMRTGQTRYSDGQLLSVPAVRKDGTRLSVDFTIVPFTDDAGRMVGIAAIMRDVTTGFEELRALRKQVGASSG